jgi:hypothetical protein
MRILGVLLLILGLAVGGIGIWRKRNPGGPLFFGNVTDSIKEMYGVTSPSNLPVILGGVSLVIGVLLLVLA